MRGILCTVLYCTIALTSIRTTICADEVPFEPILVFNALRAAYGERIQDLFWDEGELCFTVRGTRIYWLGGRMLSRNHIPDSDSYDPILYKYPIGKMDTLPEVVPYPYNRSTDFLNALVGETVREITGSCEWVGFLKHRVYVHELCREPLERIDARLREAARESHEIREYVDNIKIIFSMDRRKVDGSDALSYHAYGLALDIVPRDYGGKQVYWRWSAAWRSGWDRIPLAERWQPPPAVIDAFEQEGFVWGGKWYHFDTIHFEYRPEIIILNRQQPTGGGVRE